MESAIITTIIVVAFLAGRLRESIARDKDLAESNENWQKALDAWNKADSARKNALRFYEDLEKLLDENEDRITIVVPNGHCFGCGDCNED